MSKSVIEAGEIEICSRVPGTEQRLYGYVWPDGEVSILCMGGDINPAGEAVLLNKEDARKLRDFLNDKLKGE